MNHHNSEEILGSSPHRGPAFMRGQIKNTEIIKALPSRFGFNPRPHSGFRDLSFLFLGAAMVGAAFSAKGAVDISVTALEITQGIQTPANTVQLVANRSTAVRATIGVSGSAVPVPNVTGRLHVFVLGAEITPPAGVAAINEPFTAPISPQRANENDTLNFELPGPTGIPGTAGVDFRVDVTLPGEVNTANNTLTVAGLTFVTHTTPYVFFTRINYPPSGPVLPPDSLIMSGVGDAMFRAIYPVNDWDTAFLYRQGPFPSLPFGDPNGNNNIDEGTEKNDLKDLLASCRNLIVADPANGGVPARIYLFGWVNGNPTATSSGDNYNGSSRPGSNIAFGNTDVVRHQRTFAHEMGHLFFGAGHDCLTIDEVGWDVTGRLINNPAANNIPALGRVKPNNLPTIHCDLDDIDIARFVDIMVGGEVTANAWVTTGHHNTFLADPSLNSDSNDYGTNSLSTNILVISGVFNSNGTQVVRLNPAFTYPWLSQPTFSNFFAGAQFEARVADNLGTVTSVPFSAEDVEDLSRNTSTKFGFFEVKVAVPLGRFATNIEIRTLNGTNVFATRARSAIKPTVVITAPTAGAALGSNTLVSFTVSDADTPTTNRQYQIVFSPNDGTSWVPIAVNLPGPNTFTVFNSTEIPETRGNGRLRVIASDGLNTSFADVAGLKTTAAIYPNADEPRLSILNSNAIAIVSWAGDVMSWPANATGFRLQTSSTVSPTSWSNVTNPVPVLIRGRFTLAVPIGSSSQYYRLSR